MARTVQKKAVVEKWLIKNVENGKYWVFNKRGDIVQAEPFHWTITKHKATRLTSMEAELWEYNLSDSYEIEVEKAWEP